MSKLRPIDEFVPNKKQTLAIALSYKTCRAWLKFAGYCIHYKYNTTGNTVTANTNITHSMPQRSNAPVK